MIQLHHHPGALTMNPTNAPNAMLTETVALLESLSALSAELGATLPSLDLDAEDLAALAGKVQRINSSLVDAEEWLAFAGPVDRRGLSNISCPATRTNTTLQLQPCTLVWQSERHTQCLP